jgi:hypothetical protein
MGHPAGGVSIFVGRAIAAVEMAQAELEDFFFDGLGGARVDGFSQLLDKQVDEFGASALEVFAEGFRGDLGVGNFAQFSGDFFDGGFGEVATQLQDGGVAVFGGLSLIGFEP